MVDDNISLSAALIKREQHFRALVTAGTYSVYHMSPDWRLMYQLDSETLANTADPIEDWVDKYIPDEERATVFAAIERAIRTKTLFELEHRVRLANGSVGWIYSRAVPLLDAAGEITEWFGTGSDVTQKRVAVEQAAVERARAESALQESEQRFRLLVENVREYALVQTDLEGTITSWNPGAQRLFGYVSKQVVGQPFALLLQDEDRDTGIIAREMQKLSTGKQNIGAHFLQRQDGSRFWAEWVTEPVSDDTGRLLGTAKLIRDETERQNARIAIQNSLSEKEELLKEVHHRVKNNLQVIVSLLNMQSHQIQDKRTLAEFEEARNRVLAISSIHELLYQSESFARIKLIDYASKLARGVIEFYGLGSRLQLEVPDNGSTLELERAVPFGMLLNELITNVCKHAFPAPRTGRVSIRMQPSGGDLTLEVADDGQGLPAGFLYKDASSLGLKLVHALARQLRGTIEVFSDRGTTIRVRFPAAAAEKQGGTLPTGIS